MDGRSNGQDFSLITEFMEGKVLPKAHFSFLPDLGRINRSSSLLKKDAPAKRGAHFPIAVPQ